MHLRLFILMLLLVLYQNVRAQQSDTISSNLQTQISELQQKLSEIQKQLADISARREIPDSSKKIIIIDGQRVVISDEELDKKLRVLANDSILLGKGLKIYQNNDSVIISLGNLKLRLADAVTPQDSDSMDIRQKDDEENDETKTIKTQYLSFRMGINNYLNEGRLNDAPQLTDLELINSKSLNIGFGLVNTRVDIIKHYVRFNAGLLYDINNYRFQTDARLTPRIDSLAFTPKETNQNVSKNKLLATYLMLPVNIQFATHKESKKAFSASAGFRVGYRLGAHTKQVIDNKKEKTRDDFNLNPIKYGFTASIGYSWLHFYADYDMSSLFRTGINPMVNPIQVGIILAGYH